MPKSMIGCKALLAQQALRAVETLFQTVLKRRIIHAVVDVLGNRRADYLGYWPRFHVCNCFKRLRLFGGQTDGHGLDWLHQRNYEI